MRNRAHWVQASVIGVILAAAAGYIVTRETNRPHTGSTAAAARAPIVDERPLPTARALAALAITPEEQRFSQEAARIADREVDLAFADALWQAAEKRANQDPANRELNAKLQQAQTALADVQSRQEEVKAKLASAKPNEKAPLQERLDLLSAEQSLDEDEIEDAQEDLVKAGGDQEGAVERQRDQHEAVEHELEQHPSQPPTTATVDLTASDLAGQVRAWIWLRNKKARLEVARNEAGDMANALGEQHGILQQRVREEKPKREEAKQRSADLRQQARAGGGSVEGAATAVSSLRHFATEQKALSDLAKRMQDEQELQQLYGNWLDVTADQQRTVLHSVLRSMLWMLLVIVLVHAGGLLLDHRFNQVAPEQKHLAGLRKVSRYALQAVGVLVIAFVILGVPAEAPTIIGLAGAGLTVALKDFIVGFFGWFVLLGRNGIRVGDWVEINGVVGEVIEIGLLRTVLLESGNWTDTGHPTGRKVAFMNGFAIEGHFFNFSTAGQWLWDELQVEMAQGENPYPLVESIQRLVEEETRASTAQAEQEWSKSAGYPESLAAAPSIHLRPTASGVELQIRYITSANERSLTRSKLYEKIVALMREAKSGASVSEAVAAPGK